VKAKSKTASYCFTLVTAGIESAPSPTSNAVEYGPHVLTRVTLPDIRLRKKIYRFVGSKKGKPAMCYQVGDLGPSKNVFDDDPHDHDFLHEYMASQVAPKKCAWGPLMAPEVVQRDFRYQLKRKTKG
jgi:hypothetical protein